MADDLRDDILGILEARVIQALQVIRELRKQNDALETRVEQLELEIGRLNNTITKLQDRNAELLHFESDLQRMQAERELEMQQAEEARTQIRARLEGILEILDQAGVAGE